MRENRPLARYDTFTSQDADVRGLQTTLLGADHALGYFVKELTSSYPPPTRTQVN